ncbi:trypsin eta [Bombyx mori]|uniref:Peptidase S1 domain-containing protein n=1 Tax=Bombyx mori TaxID=7091 RepID=A0A8R2AHV3_BOMMO|nr:trypsin eta [Bombyx mori]
MSEQQTSTTNNLIKIIKMKAGCIILTVLIIIAILAVCVMVKFATDITMEERKRDSNTGSVYQLAKTMGIINLKENYSLNNAERFPYVGAVVANTSGIWSFSCFASVILVKWIVTSAHCVKRDTKHRLLLFHDYTKNYSHTYPVLYWKLHQKYNVSKPTLRHDVAVAKLNVDFYPFSTKASVFDRNPPETDVLTAVLWKTVAAIDKKMYLTNDFDKIEVQITSYNRCFESYGVDLDASLICIDLTEYEECFVHEFGPLYYEDKIVGVLAVKPRDCDTKYAIFTNVSFYRDWILKSTGTTCYG